MHIVYSSENLNITTVYHSYKSTIMTINAIILDYERADECIELQYVGFFMCVILRFKQ